MDDDVSVDELRKAIQHMHACDSRFVEAVDVHETHDGTTIWEGTVKVFDLVGHPEAQRAYAWSHPTKAGRRNFVAVLGLPPVDSAVMAVRASILAAEKKKN
jgi:hypothetical protein